MYIWRVQRLADDFRAGQVSERQQLSYLLVNVALLTIISDPYVMGLLYLSPRNVLDIAMLPAVLIIGLVGTIYCYRSARQSREPAGFLPRYICLGLPVVVRLTVFLVLATLTAVTISGLIIAIPAIDAWLQSEETTLLDVVVCCAFEILFFLYLGRAIQSSYA
jgi:hypothetical protein